jgi:outer membrane protein assembly factor BamA
MVDVLPRGPLRLAVFALGLLLAGLVHRDAHARVLARAGARAPRPAPQRPAGLPSDAELEAAGARVGTIVFDARPLFDVEHGDEDTTLSRLANKLHISTREATIEDQLLFKSGDLYRATLLQESARILRDNRYLRDADVRPIAYHDGLVDIEVMSQDVWTLNPGVSFGRKGGANTGGVEIEELNFLGLGTQIGLAFTHGVDRDTQAIFYRDRQLGSSWWNLNALYSDNSDGKLVQFGLSRPFYSLDTHWAAGVELLDDERVDSHYDRGAIVDQYAAHDQRMAMSWGRSAGLADGWARRYLVGVTYEDHQFDAATGDYPTQLLPADRRFVYPWVGAEWVQDAFRTVRNRDQIERTEDYSLGWRAHAQLGFAPTSLGSSSDAVMLNAGVSKGTEFTARQSVLFDASLDGRLESGSLAGTTLGMSARYYFRQSPRRVFFMDLSTLAGQNLDADQQILLGGDSGLRGYPLRYQAGEGRWLFTAEQRFFTNWYPFQLFNVGGAVFYDMGETWGNDPLGSPSLGLLKDVGFGLRLGNSRSALGNVLHIDVAFPLDGDSTIKNVQFLVETKKSF